jgi:hypothetical protein
MNKSSSSAASPPQKSPMALKDRLHLRRVFSKKAKIPPLLNEDNSDDDAANPNCEHEAELMPLLESPRRLHNKSIENPDRGRRSSVSNRTKSNGDKELVEFSLDNAMYTMEDHDDDADDHDDHDKALTEKTKKKFGSDSTLSTQEDDSNHNAAEDFCPLTPRTKSRKIRYESLGIIKSSCSIPRDSLSVDDSDVAVVTPDPTTKKKKQIRRASVGAFDADTPQCTGTPNGTKKKKKIRRSSLGVESIPRDSLSVNDTESTPNGTKKKKKTKHIRRASVGAVDGATTRALEDAADTKSYKKKKKIRRHSVGGVDTTSGRKSRTSKPQPVHHGTMELNDEEGEDEPPMTPRTKARRTAVGNDGKVRRKSKTNIEPLKDDDYSQTRSPSAHRKQLLSAIKPPPPPLDDAKSPSARTRNRLLFFTIKPPPLDIKSPGRVRKERARSEKSKPDDKDISADTLLNSQAESGHDSINSEISFGNPQVVHLHKNISQLKSQVETFKEQRQAANVELSRSRTELISVKLEYQKVQTQRRGLRAELRESEALVVDKDRKIAALEKAIESQLDKAEELEEQLKKAQDEIYQWQDKILLLEAQIMRGVKGRSCSNGDRAEEKNVQLDEQRHARLEKRQQELDEQLQQIKRERSHLEGLRRDNDSQRLGDGHLQQVESLKQIQAETAITLIQKEGAIQELQRKLEVAWHLNMEGMISSADTTDTDTPFSEEKLLEEKRQLSATLEKKDETIAYMQLELNRLKEGLAGSACSGDFASLEREVGARKAEAQAAKSKYQGAQKRNMLLEDDIDHWKSVNCNLEDDVQAVKAEASEWKAKYEQMQKQAGVSDSGSPGSERRASRRRASISGGLVDSLADLPSSSMGGSVSQRNSTPSQYINNDGSSLQGLRSMFSNLVSPLPLTNNSSHLRNSNPIPRNSHCSLKVKFNR